MKLLYYQGKHSNFGDDLNPWIWPQFLPHFFDDDDKTAFLGIGSIIGMHPLPPGTRKLVVGSGFVPQYATKPDISGSDWTFYFVRGPRTAQMLGLPGDLALGDSAILLNVLMRDRPKTAEVVSFMPHWESMDRGHWEEVCRLAGVNLIDPRCSVEGILTEMMRSRLILTEAMHGAIVADALRIPWISLVPFNTKHRDKYFDWAEALDLRFDRYCLWPSSLTETPLWKMRKPLMKSPLAGPFEKALPHLAAHRLAQLAKVDGYLSADNVLERAVSRMLEKIEQVKRDFGWRNVVNMAGNLVLLIGNLAFSDDCTMKWG
jgi:succinoglycan biosynthesis protein ExoV